MLSLLQIRPNADRVQQRGIMLTLTLGTSWWEHHFDSRHKSSDLNTMEWLRAWLGDEFLIPKSWRIISWYKKPCRD